MRGRSKKQVSLVSLASPEAAVPPKRPLRKVRKPADRALAELSPTFEEMYAAGGRPSVSPARFLKAMLLMALFSIRSERMLSEQLGYNLLFKWLLDMNKDMDEAPFDATTFRKNRHRILKHEVSHKFFRPIFAQARKKGLMSAEHFSVDGALLEAWASMKSFRPKDGEEADATRFGDR